MPFTGTGTGIQNASDVFFSGLAQDQVLRYNGTTAKWNNVALAITTADLADNAVTEPKLSVSNTPSSGQVLSWNGSVLAWTTPSGGTVSGQSARSALAVVYASGVPGAVRPAVTDVAQYVWVCDGTADEVEINAAISAVATQGQGKVQLVGDAFAIADTIQLKTGVWLAGEGLGTVVSASANINDGMIMLADDTVHATRVSDITLNGSGRSVHGFHYNQAGGTSGFGGNVSTSPDPAHTVQNIFIRGCGTASFAGHGMWLEGGNLRANKYSDIRILDCTGCGVWSNSPDSHYTNIEAGTSGKSGPAYSEVDTAPVGHGFFMLGTNNMIVNCKAWYSRGAGFFNKGVRNGYSNCQAQDNYSHGFHIQYGKSSFVGCQADSNGQASGSGGLGRAGFYVTSGSNTIQGCVSYDKAEGGTGWEQVWGFQFTSGCNYSRIAGCVTYGNGLTTGGGAKQALQVLVRP